MITIFLMKVVDLLWHRSYQPSRTPALTESGNLLLSVINFQFLNHSLHTLEANVQIRLSVEFDSRRHDRIA
jgi:hypothetical protein